jgi:hypothetical protein
MGMPTRPPMRSIKFSDHRILASISPSGEPKTRPQCGQRGFRRRLARQHRTDERKANALAAGMADKFQAVIDELKKPKWVPAEG